MRVIVNGDPRLIPAGTTVAELVEQVSTAPRGVAVALGGTVVPRAEWPSRALADGDAVEVLTAVQGG